MTAMSRYSDVGALSEDRPNYDELMSQYAPLVKRTAYHLMGRLPSNVQLDDLIQAGMIGLFEALKAYDSTKGASFETYARIRIRGAMIDEVRRGDWTPRSVYKKSRQISSAVKEVEEREGRDARDSEIAEAMGIGMDEYYELVKDAAGYQVLSYEDITELDGSRDEASVGETYGPYHALQDKSFKGALADKIAELPEREKLVMALYYDEEFNLREIGEILGVTEGRVCQIHGQALIRLRSRMTDWVQDDNSEHA
ncbi:MAG: RNA polymerase sigma factor FliA [Gammaproteobacteria bacterium]